MFRCYTKINSRQSKRGYINYQVEIYLKYSGNFFKEVESKGKLSHTNRNVFSSVQKKPKSCSLICHPRGILFEEYYSSRASQDKFCFWTRKNVQLFEENKKQYVSPVIIFFQFVINLVIMRCGLRGASSSLLIKTKRLHVKSNKMPETL